MAKSEFIGNERTLLAVKKDVFEHSIREAILKGDKLRLEIGLPTSLLFLSNKTANSKKEMLTSYIRWDYYNQNLLKYSFNVPISQNEYLTEYQTTGTKSLSEKYLKSESEIFLNLYIQQFINLSIDYMKRLLEILPLIPEETNIDNHEKYLNMAHKNVTNTGFLIHGHNAAAKYEVAAYIEKELGKKMIILHQNVNAGMTIIEKFEKNADITDFAVALWTADDIGAISGKNDFSSRARQNVIFETGFFSGKLGRGHVIVLREENVDIFTDYSGVAYIPFNGNWKHELRKEIEFIYQNLK